MKNEICLAGLTCRICGMTFPVRKRLDGRKATVTSCGNIGPLIEHIKAEHPDDYRGDYRECDYVAEQNSRAAGLRARGLSV